jgi:hypothetical protein
MTIPQLFAAMPGRYRAGKVDRATTYYFSIGDHKYTVKLDKEKCVVEDGKTIDNADCVLKTTPELFEKMVIHGKMPGPIDIARGKVKTNDTGALMKLRDLFDFKGI